MEKEFKGHNTESERPARWFLESRQEVVIANFIRQGHLGTTWGDKCENYCRSNRGTRLLIGFRSEGQGEIKELRMVPRSTDWATGWGQWGRMDTNTVGPTENSREQIQNKKDKEFDFSQVSWIWRALVIVVSKSLKRSQSWTWTWESFPYLSIIKVWIFVWFYVFYSLLYIPPLDQGTL